MNRVVITGLGVVAPNGSNVPAFCRALRAGQSGIRFQPHLRSLNFTCQVAGIPEVEEGCLEAYFSPEQRRAINGSMIYAGLAATECWRDAGLPWPLDPVVEPDWEAGAVFGTGIGGVDTIGDKLVPLTRQGEPRRLGSAIPEQTMCSNASALLGGLLGLGNRVTTNSSACATGTEALIDAFRHVAAGRAERMIGGSTECGSSYVGAGFDAMRVTARTGNEAPGSASRPMSATACGFVPGAGAGALLVESLSSAQRRGVRIYAEILGGAVNCGGQRRGGSITASNPTGVQRSIRAAIAEAGIQAEDIDYINGHLTATGGDPKEISNLLEALACPPRDFPWINSTKSMIGHTLGAAGSIECVATVCQLNQGFVHASLNCEDVHPLIEPIASRIPHQEVQFAPRMALKTSFGFGDVNACVVIRRWTG